MAGRIIALALSGARVRAWPQRRQPIPQRYEAAIAAAGKAEFQIAELTELRERATEGQLAHAAGNTIFAIVAAIEAELLDYCVTELSQCPRNIN